MTWPLIFKKKDHSVMLMNVQENLSGVLRFYEVNKKFNLLHKIY